MKSNTKSVTKKTAKKSVKKVSKKSPSKKATKKSDSVPSPIQAQEVLNGIENMAPKALDILQNNMKKDQDGIIFITTVDGGKITSGVFSASGRKDHLIQQVLFMMKHLELNPIEVVGLYAKSLKD